MGNNKINIRAFIFAILFLLVITVAVKIFLQNKNNTTTPSTIYDSSVTINTETDRGKRQQTLSQRLDQELAQALYTQIPGTDLEIKIPPSYSIPQTSVQILTQTPYDNNLLAVADKETDLYWKIYNCDYEYNRAPYVDKSLDESFCKNLLSQYSQKQLDSYQNLWIHHNIFIQTIQTPLAPQEWVLDNVAYQGVKLRDQPKATSRGVTRTINGFSYLAISVSCCGGYEMNYFTQYRDLQGNQMLIKFGTRDIDGKTSAENDNIVLDKILSTLKRK